MAEDNKSLLPQASQGVADEIRLAGANYYNPVVWQGMTNLAKVLIDAGACPVGLKTQAQVMVALQAGREVGLSPINALNSFYIVKGKVAIYGDSAIAVVLRDGHQIDWGKCDGSSANVKITRGDNKKSMEATFTFQEAENKKLTTYADGSKNPFWQKYPENMLKFKAFGSIARFIVADSLRGMSIKEELEGSSIDAQIVEEIPQNIAPVKTEDKAISGEVINAPSEVKHEEVDESESLQNFVKQEPVQPVEQIKNRTKVGIVKDINKMCVDNGKDPKKILAHYKKKSWLDFKADELLKIEESVKLSITPAIKATEEKNNIESKAVKTEPVEEDLATYYMPEEDVLEVVNELYAHEGATELTQEQQNLIDDVSEDKFLGKQSIRYKGLFK